MYIRHWFSLLSGKQRAWLFGTTAIIIVIIAVGVVLNPSSKTAEEVNLSLEMSIRDIAPALGVTGKALARELGLPLDVSKKNPLGTLGVKTETLDHSVHHLLSHRDSGIKYYLFAALVLWGLVS